MSRRNFLRGAGGAALALPFFGSLGQAQERGPKRLITFYMPNNETEDFLPSGSGGSFSFEGKYTQPLEDFKDRMLVLHNMAGRHGHYNAHAENLTGFGAVSQWDPAGGPSVCQLIKARLGTEVPVPYLGMVPSSDRRTATKPHTTAWTADALPIPMLNDPRAAFERVFGPVGGMEEVDSSETDRRLALQGSLLDGLMENYRHLNRRLNPGDRRLLDEHLALLREQESLLQSGPQTLTCDVALEPPPILDEPRWSSGSKIEKLQHYMNILARAIACDATRVSTIMFGGAQSGGLVDEAGITDSFHDIAHRAVAGAREKHFQVRHLDAEHVAMFVRALDSIPEGDGTALDNSVVAWLPELGLWQSDREGNSHLRSRTPALLIGGCGGYFNTGRMIDLEEAPYPRLLLTLIHAMGYEDVASFGDGGDSVLSELLA